MRADKIPFETVLDQLFEEEVVSIPLVYSLSDLTMEELAQFERRWPQQSTERRRVIARHMADISEENFQVDFSPAFGLLLEDDLEAVRLAALDGLWDSSNTSLVSRILELVRADESVDVRALAAATLGHYVLMAEWGQLPNTVGERIVTTLIPVLDQPETTVPVRRAILEAIGASPHPRIPELIEEAYASGDETMQLSAVFAMGRSADARWLPIILEEMESYDRDMRLEAARAAGIVGSEKAVPNLADMTADEDEEVQLMAIYALGQIGGDVAHKVLMSLAADPEFEALEEAIGEALEELDMLGGNIDLSILEWEPDDELDA